MEKRQGRRLLSPVVPKRRDRFMKLSPNHLKRYKEITQLFWKYGRSDLAAKMNVDESIDPADLGPTDEGKSTPDQPAEDLEATGPTYVKLGQGLASWPDLLLPACLKSPARLQDHQSRKPSFR